MTLFATCRLAAFLLGLCAVAAHADAPYAFATTPGKLPKDVIPHQYAAYLKPDLATGTFFGSETIEIEVLRATSAIVLNAAELHIDAASLAGKGMAELKLAPVLDTAHETLRFDLSQPLAPGRYRLALKFHGTIHREARGLFQLEYKAGRADKSLLATNMAPSDTRRLLPTWDEPAFRAAFKLTVDLPAHFKAVSNTPLEQEEQLEHGLQRLSFGVTPRMPSYLLVLVAGELERSTTKQDGTEIGVVTTAGKQPQAAYALAASKDLLHYYNAYFGQPYSLPKLDQIAIPGGFNGAMENWGGIVYDEATLLVDPANSPESMRKQSFIFNAHEVSHQWFGNLVTMAWWDSLWLNEGFASWMETKATAHFHPEWHVALDFQAAREGVFDLDARKTTRPIDAPIASEEQAADAFDAIAYAKGQALVQMLEAWIGDEPFRKGVRAYMAAHRMSNTTGADLWAALETASGKPVASLATSWTGQGGYPLLKVAQACEQGRRRITLTQEPYWLDEAPGARLWQVPVELSAAGGKTTTTLLLGQATTLYQPGCDGALVVDPNGVGYFRVQYDDAAFATLAGQAAKLGDSARLRLLADSWSLARSGRLPLRDYAALAASYRDEPRAAIWGALAGQLTALDAIASDAPEQATVQRFIRTLARPAFARLGWEEQAGESVDQRALRPLLAQLLIHAADPLTIEQGRIRFQRDQGKPSTIAPSMREVVLLAGGVRTDTANYDELLARLTRTESAEERAALAEALTSAADPALAARTLELALGRTLPAQTTSHLVQQVAHSGHIDLAWDFAVRHRDALLGDQEAVGRLALFPSLVSRSSKLAHADMMEAWVAANFGPDAQAQARKVGSEIRTRVQQRERLLPQVSKALAGSS